MTWGIVSLAFFSCQARDISLSDMVASRLRSLSLASFFLALKDIFIMIPRNCPPTPTGVWSRDSSGDKRHLHVSFLTPRLGGSASRWILTDLHRVETPYQYPVLVSGWVAHCLRGQYGRCQKKNPRTLRRGKALGMGNHAVRTKKDIVTTQAPPKYSGVPSFTAGCHTDNAIIVSTDRLCKSY